MSDQAQKTRCKTKVEGGGGSKEQISLITDQSLSISRYFDQLIAFFITLLLDFSKKKIQICILIKETKIRQSYSTQGRLRELWK
jgi:hypothetical protein